MIDPAETSDTVAGADVPEMDDDATDDTESLFERNLAAFAAVNGRLANLLRNHKPLSQLVMKDNGEPSVVYDDFDLYPDGGQTFADEQLRNISKHSTRLMMSSIKQAKLDHHSDLFKDAFERRLEDGGFRMAKTVTRDSSYFVVVLGLGLGVHLKKIIETSRCRVLAIAEPNLDFIYHSLSVIEWQEILELFRDGGAVYVFTDNEPSILAQSIKSLFRKHNPSSLDGTVIYRHYQSAIFLETDKHLEEEIRTAVLGLGFFQDEVNMLGQTYKNLEGGNARIMRKIAENPGLPAFLVGSGPSLNACIPFLKENADKAVIFCCGTAIDVLKGEGIEPDFWVMMERSKKVAGHLEQTQKSHDISNIRFVGSTTIFPSIPGMFRDAILFFRPGLSPSPLFARSRDEIAVAPDPMAANAAVSFALSAGFAEIYMLGIDCGSPSQGQAHAKGSMYDRETGKREDYIKNLNLPMKGNFGGTIWSTSRLQWSRENIERLIGASRGHVFYNLGNGALINGATPKHPRAVKLADPPRPKAEIVDEFVASYPVYTRDAFEQAWEKAAIIDHLPEYTARLKEIVEDAEDIDGFAYISETMKVLQPSQVPGPLALLYRGTVFTAINIFEFYYNRAVDGEEKSAILDIFKEEYCSLMDGMCDRAIEVFLGLEDGEPWDEEFVE